MTPVPKRIFDNPVRCSLLIKLMLSCILIFAIPVTVIFFLLSHASSTQAIQNAGNRYTVVLANISDTMDEVFRSVNAVQDQMQADSSISDTCFSPVLLSKTPSASYWEKTRIISRSVYEYYLNNDHIYSLELYIPYADILFRSRVYDTRKILTEPAEEELAWLLHAQDARQRKWYLETDGAGEQYFVSYAKPFAATKPSETLYTRVTIAANILQRKFRALLLDEGFTLSIRQSEEAVPVIGNEEVVIGEIPQELTDGAYWVDRDAEVPYLGVWYHSQFTDWTYILTVPIRSFNASALIINQHFAMIYACLGLALLALLLMLLTQVIQPVNQVIRAIRIAEKGDLSVRIHLRQQDELGMIAHRFNVLLGRVEQLIHENYESQMLKNEFELKFIQNQLNEHFLYNTLDSVHWIAREHHVPQISEIIFSLSHFFRLSLNAGSDRITVAQAVEILRSYITLINVRMSQGITLEVCMDESLAGETTYKYFFQPIVENAYQHGLRPKLGGRLTVRFEEKPKGWLKYTVIDDGMGMTAEKLESLRRDIREASASSRVEGEENFALKNITRQLKLYFNDQYVFSIDSEPGEGTGVCISFPLKGGAGHEEVPGCHH